MANLTIAVNDDSLKKHVFVRCKREHRSMHFYRNI